MSGFSQKSGFPIGGLSAWGTALAASLTALLAATPALEAASTFDNGSPPATSRDLRMQLAQNADGGPNDPNYGGEAPPGYDGFMGTVQDWLSRASRDYQGVIIKGLSKPVDGADDAIARKIEETRDEAERAAAKAAADERLAAQKMAEDAAKNAEEARKAAAGKAAAESDAKVGAVKREPPKEPKPVAETPAADATAEAQAQRLANEREEQAQREAEDRRKAAAEARRITEEQRLADERIAERRRAAEADERRRAEAERADAERSEAASKVEPRSADPERVSRRAIVLTTEPIRRPSPPSTMFRPELASPRALRVAGYAGHERPAPRRHHRAVRVKRWVQRHEVGVCRAAGRRIAPPGRYTVARGDSLWRISAKHYRSGRHYRKIYQANRGRIRDPDLIYPCQKLRVPRRR